MARKKNRNEPNLQEIRAENWYAASQAQHSLAYGPLSRVWEKAKLEEARGLDPLPAFGAVDSAKGIVYVNTMALRNKSALSTDEWIPIVGHLVMHLAFDHAARRGHRDPLFWNAACDLFADRILRSFTRLKQEELLTLADMPGTEEEIYEQLLERGNSGVIRTWAGDGRPDILHLGRHYTPEPEWELRLAQGIRESAADAVEYAALRLQDEEDWSGKLSPAIARARHWVLQKLPLLGAVAEQVKIIEDANVCERLNISIAAVCGYMGEMYINPNANLTYDEWLFVYVHELLHVALMHHTRGNGRDPEIYNWACDFVINAWLVEMGVGQLPHLGLLYDPELAGKTSEEIYDLLMEGQSQKRRKKLYGFAGCRGDVLLDQPGRKIFRGDVSTLDDVWRRCLKAGMALHETGRGRVPLALLEEIQSLFTPPVDWDVELARWMDLHVPLPRDWRRTYARASRRQSSTPDIPRPARYIPQEVRDACTFGVVLDTSGSMDRQLLGRALGAISSYADAREVPAVRLVLCDAAPYDRGYVEPSGLRGTYPLTGRGGTMLQPAIQFLLNRSDFPAGAPIMVITDGFCEEEIICPREHCFLLPRKNPENDKWRTLRTSAPIFRVLKEDFSP